MTEIAMVFLTTRSSIYLTILTVLAVFSPFFHLFARSGQKGVFHWQWMSSFLYSFGWGVFALSVGFLFLFASKQIENEFQPAFKVISKLIILIGVYYMGYIFLPVYLFNEHDMPVMIYYGMILLIAIIVTPCLSYLNRVVLNTENKLKETIRNLFSFIYTETDKKGYIKPEYKTDFAKRRIELADNAVNN